MKLRSRIIKPEFFQNEKLSYLKERTQMLYVGLWMLADRDGRLIHKNALIRSHLFPFSEVITCNDVGIMIRELSTNGFVATYVVEGKDYLWIPTFTKHQNVHPHEAKSVIPSFESTITERNDNVITTSDNDIECTVTSTLTSTSNSTSTDEPENVGNKKTKEQKPISNIIDESLKQARDGKRKNHSEARILYEDYVSNLDNWKKIKSLLIMIHYQEMGTLKALNIYVIQGEIPAYLQANSEKAIKSIEENHNGNWLNYIKKWLDRKLADKRSGKVKYAGITKV